MKKSWSIYLATSALAWLLTFGASPTGAYYPPLQATGSASGSGFSLRVTLPGGYVIWGGGGTPGVTISDFQNHNGVMAWKVQDGSTFSVEYCTFDPFRDKFVMGSQGVFTEVCPTINMVHDGVVAFVAKEISKTHSQFFYSTYDPAKGAWQNQSFLPKFQSPTQNHEVKTKDGVLVFNFEFYDNVKKAQAYNLFADIYDPVKGEWFSKFSGHGQEPIFGPETKKIGNVSIANATISYDWLTPGGSLHYIHGYDLSQHKWYEGPTKPGAYFVAQPSSGYSPLRVWFTDMSIAGTSWNWQFGDGTTSTNRSPYKKFTPPGKFPVSLQISGPNGNNIHKETITTSYPEMLPLRERWQPKKGLSPEKGQSIRERN